ncbi:hypothetical protein [Sphaerotilus sp.]|jgi:hypothetical protein|uniref:hypothetical protein n=1 Tax=Sphaerotilus sp. TaxID=2093942 RepID=UPI0025DCC5EC|nr:hypothetical protein [Sphaerotilus sp.]
MGAIKNNKSGLKNPERLYNRYSGVPVVYVESNDDQYVFGECWFKEFSSRLEFCPVSNRNDIETETTAGCKAVVDAVKAERSAGNPAWGVVDRDAVFSYKYWHLVHETDDVVFDDARPFGRHVKVLRLWEMESYLIDAASIEKYRSEHMMDVARPVDVVWSELLGDCQALIPHAALNAVRHEFGVVGIKDGGTNGMLNRADVDKKLVSDTLCSMEKSNPACRERYQHYIRGADAFDMPDQSDRVRMSRLLRRVHGKAMLARFESRNGFKRLKGPLAVQIKEAGQIPDELKDFVSNAVADKA